MVPASVLVLFASTLLAKNVYQAGFRPGTAEETVLRLSRILVLVIMGFALLFAFYLPNALVNLLLLGYDGVVQFFPGVVLGLFWGGVKRQGVFWGLIVGLALAAGLVFTRHDPFLGMNAGFVALVVNAAVTVVVSRLAKATVRVEAG
jgi:SSS family solute:Na+ symporter